jgi:8-oxo-dGTP pyrophosphatase MutT (NUDIX family)
MADERIRPIAIAVIRNGDRLLVFEGRDHIKQQTFYRPLGGGIEFGEFAVDAVVREIREEIGAELVNPRFLGALENVFTLNGDPKHEIVMVFEGGLADSGLHAIATMEGTEADESNFKVLWKPLADFAAGDVLHPDGLLELLTGSRL